jgi:hypothetical protein
MASSISPKPEGVLILSSQIPLAVSKPKTRAKTGFLSIEKKNLTGFFLL